MTEQEMRELLTEAIWESVDFAHERPSLTSFEDAGLLTRDEGLIVRLSNGDEFQLTIRRSG